MRVWTVQPLIVWERLQEAGTLCVDPACNQYGIENGEVLILWQYKWLTPQLQKRISGYQGRLPWWAYCEKPDLRWVRHRRAKGQPQVRIELEVDQALSFPAWAWDMVYCGQFLTDTKREQNDWHDAMRRAVPDEDLWPLPEPWRGELETSWLRLFDPALSKTGWSLFDEDSTGLKGSEADFETLRVEDVRAVTHFVGNSRWAW